MMYVLCKYSFRFQEVHRKCYHMNLLAKIYIIFQISRRHSFMNYLIPAPKVRSYYSLFCRKEGKKLLSCPKLAPFFAGGGLSRQ